MEGIAMIRSVFMGISVVEAESLHSLGILLRGASYVLGVGFVSESVWVLCLGRIG